MSGSHRRGDASHSLTDLMAGLAVAFLLLATVFIVQQRNEVEQPLICAAQLKEALKSASPGIRVELSKQDPSDVEIPLELEYDPGECVITSGAENAVTALRATLQWVCVPERRAGTKVRLYLEGHTDNQPFVRKEERCGQLPMPQACRDAHRAWTPKCCSLVFENNVRLSAARAQAAFFFVRDKLSAAERECLDRVIVVAGRGPLDPMRSRDEDQECTTGRKGQIMPADSDRRVLARVSFSQRAGEQNR